MRTTKAFAVHQKNHQSRAILIVDDSSFLRRRVREVLREDGYELVEADNGISALEALGSQEFSCILTDLVMPGMDGFSLLEEIRQRQVGAPVVVLTADIQKSTRTRCEELGATAFLHKPVNADALRSLLATLVNGK